MLGVCNDIEEYGRKRSHDRLFRVCRTMYDKAHLIITVLVGLRKLDRHSKVRY